MDSLFRSLGFPRSHRLAFNSPFKRMRFSKHQFNETQSTTHPNAQLVSAGHSVGDSGVTEFTSLGTWCHQNYTLINDFLSFARIRIPAAVVGSRPYSVFGWGHLSFAATWAISVHHVVQGVVANRRVGLLQATQKHRLVGVRALGLWSLTCGRWGNIGKAGPELRRLNAQVLAYLVYGPFRVISHDVVGRPCCAGRYQCGA